MVSMLHTPLRLHKQEHHKANMSATAILYRPDQAGRWRNFRDEERGMTYEAVGAVRVPISNGLFSPPPSRPCPQITTVEIRGQPFQVPDPRNRQFYRDLTYLEDEELISKYGLVPCPAKDYRNGSRASMKGHSQRTSTQSSRSGGSSLRSR